MSHLLLLFPLYFFIISLSAQSNNITNSINCLPYMCGSVNISYPFWRADDKSASQFCGYVDFGIKCSEIGGRNTSEITLGGDSYFIQGIDHASHTIYLAYSDVFPVNPGPNNCPRVRHNINLGTLPLEFATSSVNLSFHFGCNGCPRFATEMPCMEPKDRRACLEVLSDGMEESDWDEFLCDQIVVTTVFEGHLQSYRSNLSTNFNRVLEGGFGLRWGRIDGCEKCEESNGRCGLLNPRGFACFCSDGTTRRGDCKGHGGFGQVYKGKLSDDRLVAVKVLNSSKADGQEFINEVASIGRTAHVNIVTLLGFCYDNKKRALVYEYMPNGSLEKFVYSNVHMGRNEHIGVKELYQIALGIASGLDYLHRGCSTRILHLDIKPHNILLDEDYCPKIADFGLAKLYSRKESIVSMLEARGTIGYIAPEVYNKNFGGVSHKSDVYSYGMLLLEIVGGRKNVDAGVGSGRTSETYFPDWIYKRLHKDDFLLDSVTNAEENDYARKMTVVGLWCIQPAPNQRPSINEVIEMLEGSMEVLKVPPKPFFSSPPRSPATIYSTSERTSEIA